MARREKGERKNVPGKPHARAVTWGVILGVMLAVGLRAEGWAQQQEMHLTLREATLLALQQNLDIQIAELTPRIRAAQVTEAKGIFDVEARAGLTASSSRLLSTSTTFLEEIADGLVSQDNSQEQRFSLGIAQLTPLGGRYTVEVSETHLETTRRTSATEELATPDNPAPRATFFTGELAVTFTQPLLRDFGPRVTKNRILIAQNNLTISREEFRRQVIAVVSRVQQTYWELVRRRQELEVRHQQLALNQRLLEQIRRQVAVGTLAPIEVLQAETEIARTKERILVAENAVRDAEDRLKRVMNLSLTGAFADVAIVPVDTPAYTPSAFSLAEQIRQALEHRPELKQAQLALTNQNIALVFDRNQVLPRLDLEASLRVNGIDTSFAGSFDQFDPADRHFWEVGLVFRYPLANRQARSRLEQTRLAIRQQLLRIKDLEETVVAEVRAALRDVQTSAQRVQATRVARELAQKQLEAEEKKLQVGLATVFTVLDFQEDLAVARSNEIEALTDYQRALVRLEEAKGTLLQAYDLALQAAGLSWR